VQVVELGSWGVSASADMGQARVKIRVRYLLDVIFTVCKKVRAVPFGRENSISHAPLLFRNSGSEF
jgi:hypothetical protein